MLRRISEGFEAIKRRFRTRKEVSLQKNQAEDPQDELNKLAENEIIAETYNIGKLRTYRIKDQERTDFHQGFHPDLNPIIFSKENYEDFEHINELDLDECPLGTYFYISTHHKDPVTGEFIKTGHIASTYTFQVVDNDGERYLRTWRILFPQLYEEETKREYENQGFFVSLKDFKEEYLVQDMYAANKFNVEVDKDSKVLKKLATRIDMPYFRECAGPNKWISMPDPYNGYSLVIGSFYASFPKK